MVAPLSKPWSGKSGAHFSNLSCCLVPKRVLPADASSAIHGACSELWESICATLSQNKTKKSKFGSSSEGFTAQGNRRAHAGCRGSHLQTKLQGTKGTQNCPKCFHLDSPKAAQFTKIKEETNEINLLSFPETLLPCRSDAWTQAAFPRQKSCACFSQLGNIQMFAVASL